MMRKIAFVLFLFLSFSFSRDILQYKLEDIDDLGILLLFDRDNHVKTISKTIYHYKSYDDGELTKYLKIGDNYLVFILINFPYHSIWSCGKWKYGYQLLSNDHNLVKLEDYKRDKCRADTKNFGIKAVIINKINKDKYGNIHVENIDVKNTNFSKIIKKLDSNLYNIYFSLRMDRSLIINYKYDLYMRSIVSKKLNLQYRRYSDAWLSRDIISSLYIKYIFSSKTDFSAIIRKYIDDKIKYYAKRKNLKKLLNLQENLSDKNRNKTKLSQTINLLIKTLSHNFYNALQTRNLKKAKDIIINNGLSTTSDNQDTRSIYDIVEKISKIEKKYKVKISVDLKNPKDDISIIKDGFKIGKISQIGKTIKGVCPYKKEFLANNLTDISMKIITGCIKTGDDCTKERDTNKCFIVKDYKLLGYIASITKDAKKSDYLWSLYSKNGTFIDEYDTYENQKNLLKRYNKYTDEE